MQRRASCTSSKASSMSSCGHKGGLSPRDGEGGEGGSRRRNDGEDSPLQGGLRPRTHFGTMAERCLCTEISMSTCNCSALLCALSMRSRRSALKRSPRLRTTASKFAAAIAALPYVGSCAWRAASAVLQKESMAAAPSEPMRPRATCAASLRSPAWPAPPLLSAALSRRRRRWPSVRKAAQRKASGAERPFAMSGATTRSRWAASRIHASGASQNWRRVAACATPSAAASQGSKHRATFASRSSGKRRKSSGAATCPGFDRRRVIARGSCTAAATSPPMQRHQGIKRYRNQATTAAATRRSSAYEWGA
mmetsp:Transcript_73964/g.158511  ORF Transcript_73964/g.158511 Transcript_73964/m.158511 type:complete len:308 (+) Transcript_73964:116-1039(+)